jgi:TetR/AcrR family transcriptional regulator, fatty acid metabolism regulator protein
MRTRSGNKEQDILDAAIVVFAKQGFHKAKISSIAERAGVATGSFYLYYKDKPAVLTAIFDKLSARFVIDALAIAERNDVTPLEKIGMVVETAFEQFLANPALARVFVDELDNVTRRPDGKISKQFDKFLDIAMEIAQEGVRNGDFDPHLDVDLFRPFIIGGLQGLLRDWSERPKAMPLSRAAEGMKIFTTHCVLPVGQRA